VAGITTGVALDEPDATGDCTNIEASHAKHKPAITQSGVRIMYLLGLMFEHQT
jgi:hypothetical protein